MNNDLQNYFDRVVVINLDRRPDRLEKFHDTLRSIDWPFKTPEKVSAVDGDAVTVPLWWKQGGGAWGCLMSHARILEDCIRDNVENVLIMEDDVTFVTDFTQQVRKFLSSMPDEWDQIYLGGQHLRDPEAYNDDIYKCVNINRTHCHAVNRRFMPRMYRYIMNAHDYLENPGHHIDHRLGALQESGTVNTYSPTKWLAGQREDQSDISGRSNPTYFWNTWAGVASMPMTVILDAHVGYAGLVAAKLKKAGLHFGHRLGGYCEPHVEDEGLAAICEKTFPFPRTYRWLQTDQTSPQIYDWCRMILQEAADYGVEGGACYPHLCAMYQDFAKAWKHLRVICVDSDIEESIESLCKRSEQSSGWLRVSNQEIRKLQTFLHESKKEWLDHCEHYIVKPERINNDSSLLTKELCKFTGLSVPNKTSDGFSSNQSKAG